MFNNRRSFVIRLIGAFLLIGLMIGGSAMIYKAGIAQGIARAPEVAAAISDATDSGQVVPMPYGYGYPGYRMRPHFGFFPFGGIFGFFLFIFLFFGLMRMTFRPWGWHYGHMHGRGPWKGHGRHWGSPPWSYGDKEGEAEADVEKKKEE